MLPRMFVSFWSREGLKFWLGSEVLFYLYYQIQKRRLQAVSYTPLPSVEEREQLFRRCLAAYDDIARVEDFEANGVRRSRSLQDYGIHKLLAQK